MKSRFPPEQLPLRQRHNSDSRRHFDVIRVVLVLLMIVTGSNAQGCSPGTLYGIASGSSTLHVIDRTTGASISSVTSLQPPAQLRGLAEHPFTHDLWTVDRNSSQLGTIHPTTGAFTLVGTLLFPANAVLSMISLAFDSFGGLYGLTGPSRGQPPVLHAIDLLTMAVTPLRALQSGGGKQRSCTSCGCVNSHKTIFAPAAHSLGFNPSDGLLYHVAGGTFRGSSLFVEKMVIPTGSLQTTLILPNTDSLIAITPDGAGNFIGSRADALSLVIQSSDGSQSPFVSTSTFFRGLVLCGEATTGPTQAPTQAPTILQVVTPCGLGILYGVGSGSHNLHQINPLTGASTASMTITASSGTISGIRGLAEDPLTGILWISVKKAGQGNALRTLGTVDVATGVMTDVGTFSTTIASLAFDGGGTLYGVSGWLNGATAGSTIYTIDKSDASLTFALLMDRNGGECIHALRTSLGLSS